MAAADNSKPPARAGSRPSWKQALGFAFRSWSGWLLAAVPLAVTLELFHVGGLAIFAASAIAIVPLAAVLGDATEELSLQLGPSAGGLLNATFGNASELIIAFFALRAGQVDVVQASLTGSIIGNLLLVFGLSAFLGGLGRERQRFSRAMAGANTSMLILAVAGLVMPALFSLVVSGSLTAPPSSRVELLSEWTAAVLLIVYIAGLIFSQVTHRSLTARSEHRPPKLTRAGAIAVMLAATALIAWMSELFVGTIEPAARALGMSRLFVGVIVVATIGNAAEHAVAVVAARRDQMDLAVAVSMGSSVQIALLVGPLLVISSLFMGTHMTLVFNPFEIVAVALAVIIMVSTCLDGETNWLEGLMMLALYAILAIAFYFVPAA
jgi:Ca2+:H+ antiporter